MSHIRSKRLVWLIIASLLLGIQVAYAKVALPAGVNVPLTPGMHIMEGYLPPVWAAFWFVVALPFWVLGFRRLRQFSAKTEGKDYRLLLGLSGAFTFVLSALKIPSVTGSCSHPTGTGLGAILFGPTVMSVLGSVVLLFQALLLAHGGLTTLGANTVSMAVVGPLVAYGIWHGTRQWLPLGVSVFLAAAFADWATYVTTSIQLAVAYPDPVGGVLASFLKFGAIFAITQIPLAISEGILTAILFEALRNNAPAEIQALGVEA